MTGRIDTDGAAARKRIAEEERELAARTYEARGSRVRESKLGHLAPQLLDLKLLRLHLAVAGKGLRRIGRKELHPFAQLVLMDIQIPRRLRHAHSAILDQADRLHLELTPKLSSPHAPPPVS